MLVRINNPKRRVNSRRGGERGPDIDDARRTTPFFALSAHVPTIFNAISLIATTEFSPVPVVASRPVRPPSSALFREKKSRPGRARSNKLQLLESTFELRLGRARYDSQRNPVSRIATVMNSSDVAGGARKEDHTARSPSGAERDRERSATRSRALISLGAG